MKKTLAVLLCLSVMLGGCSLFNTDTKSYISKRVGVDISKGTEVSSKDSHGGFMGDGETIIVYTFDDNSVEEEISQNNKWSNVLTKNTSAILYGSEYLTEHVIYEESCRIYPAIENGYYFFYDRHSEATDPYNDAEVNNRYSFNYTVAAYDCDTDTLYFIETDT